MAEQGDWKRETLLTVAVSRAEVKAIRNNAAARGLSVSSFIRRLLAQELVDLQRQEASR